jgi:hypothetical protein
LDYLEPEEVELLVSTVAAGESEVVARGSGSHEG